jgi:CRP-like cAMP-binding protein
MENDLKSLKILKNNILFGEIEDNDIQTLLNCLGAVIQKYDKNNIIFLAGDEITKVGIVLTGSVSVVKENISGDRNILASISSPDVFGETFACIETKESPITVIANSKCEILLIEFNKIIKTCPSTCSFHAKLIENMLKLMANKNIMLNAKLEILSAKTTRDKLIAYFSFQGKKKFTILFNRDQLADYLNVNRSSMSRELCKMRDENIIKFEKNKFEVLL